ncbi:MAG TPA: hypothetical protein VHA33_29230 [Candidatus Angelobacter sp.]|jgi:hypothetical protein|nr:hypothetical protein [Candidatus Angelobacter sp.]
MATRIKITISIFNDEPQFACGQAALVRELPFTVSGADLQKTAEQAAQAFSLACHMLNPMAAPGSPDEEIQPVCALPVGEA